MICSCHLSVVCCHVNSGVWRRSTEWCIGWSALTTLGHPRGVIEGGVTLDATAVRQIVEIVCSFACSLERQKHKRSAILGRHVITVCVETLTSNATFELLSGLQNKKCVCARSAVSKPSTYIHQKERKYSLDDQDFGCRSEALRKS